MLCLGIAISDDEDLDEEVTTCLSFLQNNAKDKRVRDTLKLTFHQ